MNFPQFALNNVRRNSRIYTGYLLSSAFMVMIFFTYAVFIYHPEIQRAPMGALTLISMQVAAYVVFIFAIFFVLYSISAFLKSRNKEFGILMILGAQAGQINRLIVLENMLIGSVAIVTGIAGGLLLAKLFLLFSARMIAIQELAFYWPTKAIILTAGCFLALFMAISLFTLMLIRKRQVLELLMGSSSPKRAPKASIWFSLLGIILLVVAFVALYQGTIAPKALMIAVCFGIPGTYFFYTQLSVIAVRLLTRNRKRVWRGTNLLWLSELSYKLKDNARMLFLVTVVTSIACISTAFVVAVDMDNKQQFMNNKFAFSYDIFQPKQAAAGLKVIEQKLQEAGIAYERYRIDSLLAARMDGVSDPTKSSDIEIVRASQIHAIADLLELQPIEPLSSRTAVAVHTGSGIVPERSLELEGVKPRITIVKEIILPQMSSVSQAGIMLIVDDGFYAQLKVDLYSRPKYLYDVPAWSQFPTRHDQQFTIGRDLYEWNQIGRSEGYVADSADYVNILRVRSDKYWSTKDTTSVFSFIGIFIAIIFSISTASFLYFKLYTELSADSRMYRALSKIGLSAEEMSAAATKQLACLFFIPIVISMIQTFVVLKPVLSYMRITSINMATITVALVFLAIQAVYFAIARSRYIAHLQRVTL